ncbi:LOW QUALITY PROTEIN: adapter molecule Crk-like [Paramacrobiotus metropolitanus]|uniref:LOW QUALITY PROTEIN: adapter molecule Crk-like n=1 Tax=Paramacrobiotus metropolitanus TaxID=2943436 RepID=UPI002446356D|nr:LOW QUALITY PROTEIN: adapter molecule Crk-like [Paramacrobiotus metropolitanus]
MAADFDPLDRDAWYFGLISREESVQILKDERESGVFLVRDSTSSPGDYVLCVKEDNKVSHYIINKTITDDDAKLTFRIGEQDFSNLSELLSFYKYHYLDTTPLIRPAKRKLEQVITKYDFAGRDPDDLPFKRNEILTIIRKDEEQWWTAKNADGNTGSIPVTYVQKYDARNALVSSPQNGSRSAPRPSSTENPTRVPVPRTLPAFAKAIKDRQNIHDDTQLSIKVGDVIEVTNMNANGWWDGSLNGKTGRFPATYVEWVEDANGTH